jgi:enamine deaminase RidA (YjgF/YER057c/UK114 family)
MSDQQTKPRPGATALLPSGWPAPKGYANGIRARGELVFVAGQVGWDTHGRFAPGFVAQVRKALQNIVDVLETAGAKPEHVVRLTWYVIDMAEYRASLAVLGGAYRDVMGRNYPTMTLVEVKSLAEPEALVEIEATAVVPD